MGMQLHKTIILSSCKLQLVQLVVIETIYMLALCDQLIFFFWYVSGNDHINVDIAMQF